MTSHSRVNRVVSTMLIVAGVNHLLPLAGVLGGERLTQLYGMPIEEPHIERLMRLRAVLVRDVWHIAARRCIQTRVAIARGAAGLVSAASFLVLASAVGELNAHLQRVVVVDAVVVGCVLPAAILLAIRRPTSHATNHA